MHANNKVTSSEPACGFSTTPSLDGIFGLGSAAYAEGINRLLPSLLSETYTFETDKAFRARFKDAGSIRSGHRVYWTEMLSRAHLAASSSLIRTAFWCNGIVDAVQAANVYTFCSATRGFLEAAGDTITALLQVPMDLAQNFDAIDACLRERPDAPFLGAEDLEDALINFAFGRRLKKRETEYPDSHRAAETQEYIKKLESAAPGAYDLYQHLCNVTHPAYLSVLGMFYMQREGETEVFNYVPSFSPQMIEVIKHHYRRVFETTFQMSLNLPIVTLATVNKFGLFSEMVGITEQSLRGMPLWEKVKKEIHKGAPVSKGRVAVQGRNELCNCGSGKKYKKCHGA